MWCFIFLNFLLVEIKPRVLKELATEIAPILTIIFQISLESGVVPSDWKV
jgi:hypothetical protein